MMKAIMYHYVRRPDPAFPHFTFLHFDDFCRQLDFFSSQYNILHPDELQQTIQCGSTKKGIVLTFDDGLKDHYQYVFPELQRRGLSAIFYISTGVFSTHNILGVHRLHVLLGKAGGEAVYNKLIQLVDKSMLQQERIEEFTRQTYQHQLSDSHTQMVKRILNFYIRYEYRQDILDELMEHFVKNEAELLSSFYVSEAEVKEMHNAGMTIGSHTITHPVMSKLTRDEQSIEINTSINCLEQLTGGLRHKTFCYPHGGFHSFNADTEQILRDENFSYSFNVEPRDIVTNDINNRPQALPRFDCNMFPHGKIYTN